MMTHLEIYQDVKAAVPAALMEKYAHLCYGEMADVPELAPWAHVLRWAEAQWENVATQEAMFL